MKNSAPLSLLVLFLGAALPIGSVAQTSSTPTKPKTAAAAKKSSAKAGTAQTKKTTAQAAPALTTEKQKASYALGYNLGRNLHGQLVDVDPALVSEGMKDGYEGKTSPMTDDEIRGALTQLQQNVRATQEAKLKELTQENEKAGEAFLAANKTKEGVVTLPSGLEYKVLTQGTGPKPTAGDTVVCNYRGTLIDGKEFDSSYKRGEPATFPVSGVIKGWTEALQLMPVGSKWQLFVPASLAYGDRGAGNAIAPGSALIFEVELLSIKPKESTQPAALPKAGEAETPAAEQAGSETAKPDAEAAKPAAETATPASGTAKPSDASKPQK